MYAIITIKHDFHYINICQVPRGTFAWPSEGRGRGGAVENLGFQQLPRHLTKFMHEKPCFMNQVLLKNNPETENVFFCDSCFQNLTTVQPLYNSHPWDSKKWLLLGGDRFGEVKYTFIVKPHFGDIKTGCYREVAVVER